MPLTERDTNQALNVFAQHWTTLPWAVADALTAEHPDAVRVARQQVWQQNSRSAYAIGQGMRAGLVNLATAITRHVTSAGTVVVPPTP